MTGTRTVPLLLVPIPDRPIICYLNILGFFKLSQSGQVRRPLEVCIRELCYYYIVFAIKPSHQNPGNI